MDWKLLADIAEFIVLGLVALYAHLQGKNRVTEDRLAASHKLLQEEISKQAVLIAGQQAAISHMAVQQAAINQLLNRLGELHGDIEKVAGRLEGIGRAVDLINQHLLSNSQ